MVQAILEGRKTQTRRVVKPPKQFIGDWFFQHVNFVRSRVNCPYGQTGDVLWVRETFGTGKGSGKTYYKANAGDFNMLVDKWKPSIFMPKDAARIWLRITSIRVERLHDISEKDAILEGVEKEFSILFNEWRFKDYYNVKSDWRSAVSSFQSLWANINGINSWNSNPFVWVIEFERIEKPSEV